MPTPSGEKRALLEAERARLKHELGVLEAQWNKKHRLAVLGLLTIPAYFVWGLPALMLGLLATPALVATQAYLLGVRRAECRDLLVEVDRQLRRLSSGPN